MTERYWEAYEALLKWEKKEMKREERLWQWGMKALVAAEKRELSGERRVRGKRILR